MKIYLVMLAVSGAYGLLGARAWLEKRMKTAFLQWFQGIIIASAIVAKIGNFSTQAVVLAVALGISLFVLISFACRR